MAGDVEVIPFEQDTEGNTVNFIVIIEIYRLENIRVSEFILMSSDELVNFLNSRARIL